MVGIKDCRIITLPTIGDRRGKATFASENESVPFNIKRIYYLHKIPKGGSRGAHAHKREKQIVVAISGSFDVLLDDGRKKKVINLNDPTKGLFISPMIWREFYNFSKGGVLLAVVDDFLDEEEYIRDYNTFKKIVLKRGKK